MGCNLARRERLAILVNGFHLDVGVVGIGWLGRHGIVIIGGGIHRCCGFNVAGLLDEGFPCEAGEARASSLEGGGRTSIDDFMFLCTSGGTIFKRKCEVLCICSLCLVYDLNCEVSRYPCGS